MLLLTASAHEVLYVAGIVACTATATTNRAAMTQERFLHLLVVQSRRFMSPRSLAFLEETH